MERQRLGFIGLGNMGLGIASRLAESGYDVAVFNRTRSKSDEVGRLGARVADSPADVAAGADVLLLSVADQHVVTQMLFGERGAFGSLPAGAAVVDMSTVPPSFARDLAGRAADAGYRALDACVLGAPHHARTGELRVMVGGEEGDFRALESLFETVGKEVTYLGGNGMGATMKLVLNMLMGVQMPALAEAVVFGEQAGLPREAILKMIAGSGYSSPVMTFRCPMMEKREFGKALFKLSLMRKDMMLLLGEAQELGVPMPVAESAYAMLTAAKQQGLGELDVAAMVAFMERLAGIDTYPWPVPAGEGAPAETPAGRPPGRP
jgi:3-hydroxyisobutyrate dehydrogenase